MASKKKNNILWWIIVGGAAIMLFSSFTKPTPPTEEPNPQPNPNPGTGGGNNDNGGLIASRYPIVYNKYHNDAKQLQFALMVDQDGIIGPKSLLALKTFFPSFNTAITINSQSDLNDLIQQIYQIRTGFPYGGIVFNKRIASIA